MGTILASVPVGAVFRRHERGGGIQVQVGQNDPRHRSSVVEHTLGKGEVTGSSPVGGFDRLRFSEVRRVPRSPPATETPWSVGSEVSMSLVDRTVAGGT